VRTVIPHALAVAITCGILTPGLWPFHAPLNEVSWLGDVSGLRFGNTPISSANRSHALNRRMSAASKFGSKRGNWGTPIRSSRSTGRGTRCASCCGSLVPVSTSIGVSAPPTPIGAITCLFPTLSPGPGPCSLAWLPAQKAPKPISMARWLDPTQDFLLDSDVFTGRLLIGNSPFGNDSWSGRLLGVAIYDRAPQRR
jgi:hypothetical protein